MFQKECLKGILFSYPQFILLQFISLCDTIGLMKLVMMKGLPGSGKSTEAFRLVKEEGYKRVNKDDLRAMIDGGKWSKDNEPLIKSIEGEMTRILLKRGFNVVVDDTNFGWEESWEQIAKIYEADFEIKFIDTPIDECIKRDAKRGDKSVGAEVIFRMYNQYILPNIKKPRYNKDLPDAYIFDIDGTLAHMKGRKPFDWGKVGEDSLDENVAHVLDALRFQGRKILIVSGRSSIAKGETEQWLEENDIKYDALFMRPAGDNRKDAEIKKELYDNNIKDKYNVLGVFDDRDQVVSLWRSLGLTCFQCAYGAF